MDLNRKSLVEVLNKVMPAVASSSQLEALNQVWFDGGKVWGYDDVIGIETSLDVPLSGGFRVDILLGLLNSSSAETVSIDLDGATAKLVMGKSKSKLAYMPISQSPWRFPVVEQGTVITLDKSLLNALDMAMISVNRTATDVYQKGVTVLLEGDQITYYSTDSKTLTCVLPGKKLSTPVESMLKVILSHPFCVQLLKLAKDEVKLVFGQGYVVAYFGTDFLFGRLFETSSPLDFDSVINRCSPEGTTEKMRSLPVGLSNAVDRAVMMVTGASYIAISLSNTDKELLLKATGPYGDLNETLIFDSAGDNAKLDVPPKFVKRAISVCTRLVVSEACLILDNGEENPNYMLHLIAPAASVK